eukprot:CAMPEP_0198321440 /NCGR_PEP_ID=MMETSP1450-20131203/10155_1 /TAXON_ID=753684 ORGANISM="Madagascaria erythrocladiodes, Strain CCMP3234" /NCGR_SAMPLE_ID=MMETSP1450 /ASSEMBLY_ACC=CAM_ASM_001115 /LENGTH=83 /DNA_ID=CAMNT_0044025005 /DNA_START=48 /DNA_END=296 /DNA_ORIENTATION=-
MAAEGDNDGDADLPLNVDRLVFEDATTQRAVALHFSHKLDAYDKLEPAHERRHVFLHAPQVDFGDMFAPIYFHDGGGGGGGGG